MQRFPMEEQHFRARSLFKFEFELLEWGGAEPLPRASFQRREKGGATEDPVFCVWLCPFGAPKRKKMETSRVFSYQPARAVVSAQNNVDPVVTCLMPRSFPHHQPR